MTEGRRHKKGTRQRNRAGEREQMDKNIMTETQHKDRDEKDAAGCV